MSIVIILVALALLGGIVVVATGRGGELARDAIDQPSSDDLETAADVARYRPPAALLGYHAGATEYALLLIGRTIADRDEQIAWLRARLRELQPEGEREDGTLVGLQPPGNTSVGTSDQDRPDPEEPDPMPPDDRSRQAAQMLGPDQRAQDSPVVQAGPVIRGSEDA